jgi:ferrous iron transport protein B
MFQGTFTLGQYPMDWIDGGIGFLTGILETHFPGGMVKDLVINGIIAGVGSVIVFLPNILILFFFIALFEDTGYMSRAAFLMDKIMHLIGLHGKSFIPMIIGFGCNVPAIMAARTLESEKDRILTILITPFMSCSARLPIYIVLAGTFFGVHAGSVIFGIYLTGIVLSVITGRLFRSTLLKGGDAPFVMELPPYRAPMARSLLIHMWDRANIFLKKMGGIILVGSVVIWALSTFPAGEPAGDSKTAQIQHMESSFMGRIGKTIEPVFAPIGIDWRGGVALLSGFVAKEIVVSTMGVLYAADSDESDALKKALLASGMTPLSALAMMVFVLLYVPCLATIAAIKRETGSMKWTLFSITYSTGLAWVMAFVVYQGGRLLGLG